MTPYVLKFCLEYETTIDSQPRWRAYPMSDNKILDTWNVVRFREMWAILSDVIWLKRPYKTTDNNRN